MLKFGSSKVCGAYALWSWLQSGIPNLKRASLRTALHVAIDSLAVSRMAHSPGYRYSAVAGCIKHLPPFDDLTHKVIVYRQPFLYSFRCSHDDINGYICW